MDRLIVFVVLVIAVTVLAVYAARKRNKELKHTEPRSLTRHITLGFAFTVGLLFFLFGDFVHQNLGFPEEWTHPLQELGFFVAVSLGAHFIYLQTIKIEDISEFAAQVSYIVNKDRNFSKHGLNRVSMINYESLLKRLQRNDILYWHDTYVDAFWEYDDDMNRALERGAKIRVLAIEPRCENAYNRALEVSYETDFFTAGCNEFAEAIKKLMERSGANQFQEGDADKRSIDIRIYRDSPGIPFYLIERDGVPRYACTGFFLNKASQETLHLEWDTEVESEYPDPRGFLSQLSAFFKQKWERAIPLGKNAPWIGRWFYAMYDEKKPKEIYNSGQCTIMEQASTLVFDGHRNRETKIINGQYVPNQSCYLKWDSVDGRHKSNKDGTVAIKANFSINDDGTMFEGMFKLRYREIIASDGGIEHQIFGTYTIANVNGDKQAAHINTRRGHMLFKRYEFEAFPALAEVESQAVTDNYGIGNISVT